MIFKIFLAYFRILDRHFRKCNMKTDARLVHHTVTMRIHINDSSHRIFLVWKQNCRTSNHIIFCVRRRNCGTEAKALAECQVSVYFLCGSGTTGLPSIIPCAEAECQILNSHNILCAEAELRNLRSRYRGDRT